MQTLIPMHRDRVIVFGAVILVTLLAATYTIAGIGMSMSAVKMTAMSGDVGHPMATPASVNASAITFLVLFLMWWMMMVAMMVPGATPTLLLFAAVKRSTIGASASGLTMYFLVGYLLAWAVFSFLAALMQCGLSKTQSFSVAMMTLNGSDVAGIMLLSAGFYQLTPLKRACLDQCRSPTEFLSRHYRKGRFGAMVMGIHHGAICLGCCWVLMSLLFVGGVMNLWWIVGLAVIASAEKLSPPGSWLPAVVGIALITSGSLLLLSALW